MQNFLLHAGQIDISTNSDQCLEFKFQNKILE
jgi:hypothetical protein